MTYEESKPLAKKLAEQALSKGFDVEAFIILTLLNNEKDDVPDSEVDDKIEYMYSLFLSYIETHDTKILAEFLDTNCKMIGELLHSATKLDEISLFNTYANNIETIISNS